MRPLSTNPIVTHRVAQLKYRQSFGFKRLRRASPQYLKYGLTREKFDQMVIEQQGRCAICWDPLYKLHIDHDHVNGEIRGLLCFTCNVGLGNYQDDPRKLICAALYLLGR